jgi:peptidoglycan/LPS O-acetylase OafA/YrhL
LAVLSLAGTVLLAQVNLVAVERPFRRFGHRISDSLLRERASAWLRPTQIGIRDELRPDS